MMARSVHNEVHARTAKRRSKKNNEHHFDMKYSRKNRRRSHYAGRDVDHGLRLMGMRFKERAQVEQFQMDIFDALYEQFYERQRTLSAN